MLLALQSHSHPNKKCKLRCTRISTSVKFYFSPDLLLFPFLSFWPEAHKFLGNKKSKQTTVSLQIAWISSFYPSPFLISSPVILHIRIMLYEKCHAVSAHTHSRTHARTHTHTPVSLVVHARTHAHTDACTHTLSLSHIHPCKPCCVDTYLLSHFLSIMIFQSPIFSFSPPLSLFQCHAGLQVTFYLHHTQSSGELAEDFCTS